MLKPIDFHTCLGMHSPINTRVIPLYLIMKHLQFSWIKIIKDGFHPNTPIFNMSRGVVWVWEHSWWRNKLYSQGSNKAMWIITVLVTAIYSLKSFFISSLFCPPFSSISCCLFLQASGNMPWINCKLGHPGHVYSAPFPGQQCFMLLIPQQPIYNLSPIPRLKCQCASVSICLFHLGIICGLR